ncbi:MAG: uroporphyrinogen-III synthase [Bacteroidota bacterium]
MNLLKGKRILVTKSAEDCGAAFNNLINQGVELIYLPTIKIIPTYNKLDLSDLIVNAQSFDFVVFTSANTVNVFSELVSEYKPDLSMTKVAAIGKATAEACRSHGIYVHLIPDEFSSKGLINKFSEMGISNKKILVPGSSIARDELLIRLTELGAHVIKLPIYDVNTISIDEIRNELNNISDKKPDLYVFTSPSSFNGFTKIVTGQNLNDYLLNRFICAIGTTTEEAIKSCGYKIDIVPQTFSLKGVAESILQYFSKSYKAV